MFDGSDPCTNVRGGGARLLHGNVPLSVTESGNHPAEGAHDTAWETAQSGASRAVRFSIAWWAEGPERVGQSFIVSEPRVFGRIASPDAVVPRWVRPKGSVEAPSLEHVANLSRRHLELVPEGHDAVRVRNVGRRPMGHNGQPVVECVVRPGDVLHIEEVAVLVVDLWPLEAMRHPSALAGASFAFGEPDGDGMVGESSAAWEHRARLAEVAGSGKVGVPPLRDRRADIVLIARELVRRAAEADPETVLAFCQDRDPRLPRLSPALAEALVLHDYPADTRELERLLLLSLQTSPGTHLGLTPAVAEALGEPKPRLERPFPTAR